MKVNWLNIFLAMIILSFPLDLFSQAVKSINAQAEHEVPMGVETFIEMMREISAQYQDINNANLDGFISFGPDMPNMGQHYILPERAVSREISYKKPSVLCYLKIGDKYVLTGIAYTYPIGQDEKAPDLPFDEMNWHYHSGNLEMEGYGITDQSTVETGNSGMRLAMLHAWVWIPNPDGVFTADHWGLSFERSGLVTPTKVDSDASRALFMMHEGVEYYSRFIEISIEPDPETFQYIQNTFRNYAKLVEARASFIKDKRQVSASDQKELKQIWIDMWAEIQKRITEEEWQMISNNLFSHHDH